MEVFQCILTRNDCFQAGRKIIPKGVMVHSTGVNNPRLSRYLGPDDGRLGVNSYGNHWNMPGLPVCVHGFIGRLADGTVAAYQSLPWDHRGWHCGRSGNDTHISFEICEDDGRDRAYFEATRDLAIGLTAHLCGLYGLDPLAPGVVVDHAEGHTLGIASNHSDVAHWWSPFGYTMDHFRRAVAQRIKEVKKMTEAEVQALLRRELGPRYRTLGDVTAPDYRRILEKLAAKGYLKGRGGEGDGLVLDLTESQVRPLVILGRVLEKEEII